MAHAPQPTDDTTAHVLGAVEGNVSSLDWVVARFQPLVEAHIRYRLGPGFASSGDIEDLAQDVWFITMQKLRGLESRDGHFGAVLSGFLSSTSTFLCNNFLRKRLRRGETSLHTKDDSESARDVHAVTDGVVTRVARDEVHNRLGQALGSLDEIDRNVLVLRLLERQSLTSIASTLGLGAATVSSSYRSALARLRRELPADAIEAIRSCTIRL